MPLPHDSLDSSLNPPDPASHLNAVAVCMSGATRTIVHPLVVHTMRHHLLQPLDADLYAVLNLGTDTAHKLLSKHQSELTLRGSERWRVEQALSLLAAREVIFLEDEEERLDPPTCEGSHGAWTWMAMMWGIQRCGQLVEAAEATRGAAYSWVVRTRPDTFFREPIQPPPLVATTRACYCCDGNDAFYMASRAAVPGLFSPYDLAFNCRWVGNSSLARSLPSSMQCGLQGLSNPSGFIWPDCVFRLAAHRHGVKYLGCEGVLGTRGRDFFRAYACDLPNCTGETRGWNSRNVNVFFPMLSNETRAVHGNMSIDADVYEWGVASGAIVTPGAGMVDATTRARERDMAIPIEAVQGTGSRKRSR